MNFKVMLRTLTVSAIVSLGVMGAAGTAAIANAATVHLSTSHAVTAHPVGAVSPDDGGAGNG